MAQIQALNERNEQTIERLLAIWESSVRKTHTFLTEADIEVIKPDVKNGLIAIKHLYGVIDDVGVIQGFMGVENKKIEMLFIHADSIGHRLGKQLLKFALVNLAVTHVDVNEQNQKALGFYQHMGFMQINRSEQDEQGRPFPILHLKLKQPSP